jgi:hypothetical protein
MTYLAKAATQQRRDARTCYGSRVLTLTPAHLRKPAAPTGIFTNSLLPAAESAPVMATEGVAHYRHYFRREDLYRLVWTSPVCEIAVRLGVSEWGWQNSAAAPGCPFPHKATGSEPSRVRVLNQPLCVRPPKGLPEWLRIRGTKPARAVNGGVGNSSRAA